MKRIAAVLMGVIVCAGMCLGSVVLYAPAAGDVTCGWNTKSSAISYGGSGNTLDVSLWFGGSYGNDYTVAIIEIPVFSLSGKTLTSAVLSVNALGFGTNYYSGSAQIGWLDTGTKTLTGNPAADGLGSSKPLPGGFKIWDYYDLPDGTGLKTFDFLTQVQSDIDAGRSYSTFVLHCSRDTYGSISAAESGLGPKLTVTYTPEPATLMLLAAGAVMLRKRRS